MKTPYFRIKGESSKAYHAFCHYRDLPAYDRSVRKAWLEHLAECPDVKQVARREGFPKGWERWCAKFSWVERARISDEEQMAKRRGVRAARLRKAKRNVFLLANKHLETLLKRIKEMDPDEIPAGSIPVAIKVLQDAIVIASDGDQPVQRVELGGEVRTRTEPEMTVDHLSPEEQELLAGLLLKAERGKR